MQDEEQTLPTGGTPRRRSWRAVIFVGVLAFVFGAAVTGWLVADGKLRLAMPGGGGSGSVRLSGPPLSGGTQASADGKDVVRQSSIVGGIETRLALLEERMARLDLQASAASGHAARAEGLLIAFAARRVIAKGGELGMVEDQLKLRFGGAQPEAVRTIIDFAHAPVTLDALSGGLDGLAPALADAPDADRGWGWIRDEVSSLFAVRRGVAPTPTPADQVRRARLLLASGRIAEAIEEVQRMPGAGNAGAWIGNAHRYDQAQAALDVIETAAMLEPRLIQDGQGARIDEPSPLTQPTPEAAPAPAPTPAR